MLRLMKNIMVTSLCDILDSDFLSMGSIVEYLVIPDMPYSLNIGLSRDSSIVLRFWSVVAVVVVSYGGQGEFAPSVTLAKLCKAKANLFTSV